MQSSDEMTTFSVNLSGVPQSRATTDPTVGKGLKVNKLYYAVYQDGEHVYPAGKNGVADIVDFKANVNLPILKGETYDIVFWAQAGSTTVYNISDLREITVNYQEADSNMDEYDAFYNALKNFKADGNNHPLELRRPFAQLNLGTSYKVSDVEAEMGDWQKASLALKNKNIPPVTHFSVKVDGLADTFTPLDGKASGDVEETFQSAEIIGQTFKIGDKEYYNLSLNYLLVPGEKAPQGLKPYTAISSDDKALVDVTYTLYRGEGNELFTMNKISSVPVKRNHRTNIVGELLTSTEYDINIKPEGDDSDTNKEIRNIKFSALASEMASHTSEEPVIYNVSGLSTTDGVVIEIPGTFNAKQATFNFTDIKDGTTLEIKDASGSTYTGSIYVNLPTTEGHNLTSTVVNLPGAHAELLVGNFGAATVTTSQTTLVVGEGAKVTTLTVQGGNVEIQTGGDVDEIKVDENAGIIIVALGDDVEVPEGVENNEQIILAGTDDAESTETTVYVAQVGEYKFTDLNDAVAAISKVGEVKMIGNCVVTSTVTIPAGKTITLELNGMTISQSKECTESYSMIENNGTLTIKDSSEGKDGKISFKDTGSGDSSFGWGSYTIRNSGTLVVENGTIEHLGEQEFAKHMICAIFQYSGSTTINGGTISTPNYRSARLWKGDMTINGGTFDGQLWVQAVDDTAELTINGGTFKPEGNDVSSVFIGNVTNNNVHCSAKFNVTGGTFMTKIGCNDVTKLIGELITGGTFTKVAKDNTNEALINSDYKFVESGEFWRLELKGPAAEIGSATYETLQKAIDAVKDGETIKLLENVTFKTGANGSANGISYTRAASFTLDLNGKTVTSNLGNIALRFKIGDGNEVANTEVTIQIKNGKIISGADNWCAISAATADNSGNKLNLNLSDLDVENSKAGDYAIKSWAGAVINANNVKVTSSYGGSFYAVGGEMVLDNCTAIQTGLHTEPYMSMAVAVSYNGKMTVNSGNYSTTPAVATDANNQGTSHGSWCAGVMNSGGTLIIKGGTFSNDNFGENSLATAARGLLLADVGANIQIEGGTFNALEKIIDIQNNLGDASKNPSVTLSGGIFSADPQGDYINVAEGYGVTEDDGTYTVSKSSEAEE